jgi:hypothetical protein
MSAERIVLAAELPHHPYPGLPYTVEARWDYRRLSDQGDFVSAVEKKRHNEHVLRRQRVWTDRSAYAGGERVEICAEIGSLRSARPEDYFVVAQCFPLDDRNLVRSRALTPGRCKHDPQGKLDCFDSFPGHIADENTLRAPYPVYVGPFRITGPNEARFDVVHPTNRPQPSLALRVPYDTALTVDVTPMTNRALVDVSHTFLPVEIRALNDLGQVVDTAKGGTTQNQVDRLKLQGPGITRLIVTGGGGEGLLHGLCVERDREHNPNERLLHYRGTQDLDLRQASGRWAVVLTVQTVDNSPAGTDPIVAAQTIGGLTASANVAEVATCVIVLLLDHAFDVI